MELSTGSYDLPQHTLTAYSIHLANCFHGPSLSVGANDNRVSPWASAKFAARLQTVATDNNPVLLRVERDAGHGFGSTRDQAVAQLADEWSFLLWQAGDPEFQPKK